MSELEKRLTEIRRRSEVMKQTRRRLLRKWVLTATPAVACLVLGSVLVLPRLQPSAENGSGEPGRGNEIIAEFAGGKESAMGTDGAPAGNDPASDTHLHMPALTAQLVEVPVYGSTQNPEITLHHSRKSYIIKGQDAAQLEQLLYNLKYDPNKVCRCMAQYRADTEKGSYSIHLEYDFVRCDAGQADLTVEQTRMLRQIIDRAVSKEDS